MKHLAVMLALLLAACAAPPPEPPPVVPGATIMGIDWTARELYGAAVAPGVSSTLRIEPDGRVYGSGGCNRFFGGAKLEGPALTLGPLGSSRMACEGPKGEQEQRFLIALDATRRYEVQDGALRLFDSVGALLVVLRR